MSKLRCAALCAVIAGLVACAQADVITLSASDDAWVNGNLKTTNYGTNTNMRVKNGGNVSTFQAALLKFDFSPLTSLLSPGQTIQINSVRVRLWTSTLNWTTNTNYVPIAVYQNTSDWSESTVTYNTKPTYNETAVESLDHFGLVSNPVYFTGTNVIATTFTGAWLEYQSSEVKDLVQGWANGTVTNYGLTIMQDGVITDNRQFQFSKREAANAAPSIVVNYTIIPEPATVGLFMISGVGALLLCHVVPF